MWNMRVEICTYTQSGEKSRISPYANHHTHPSNAHIWFHWHAFISSHEIVYKHCWKFDLLDITWYTHRYGKMRMGMTASGTPSPGNLSFCAKNSNRVWVSVMLILHCICYVYCQIQPMTNVNWNPGHWLYSMWVQYTNTSHDDVLPVCYQWFVAGTENLQVAYAT